MTNRECTQLKMMTWSLSPTDCANEVHIVENYLVVGVSSSVVAHYSEKLKTVKTVNSKQRMCSYNLQVKMLSPAS